MLVWDVAGMFDETSGVGQFAGERQARAGGDCPGMASIRSSHAALPSAMSQLAPAPHRPGL
jgi:hypothetical protein